MIEGYKGLHLGAIRLRIQPLFLIGKNVTCFLAIFDTRWQTFEKALISTVKVGFFHKVIDEDPSWGHFVICEAPPMTYYAFWIMINIYTNK